MVTFKGRVYIFGTVFIFIIAALSLYLLYQISYMSGLSEKDRNTYATTSSDIHYVQGMFGAYQFEVNRMISSPSGYSASDVSTSPIRRTIEEKLENIGDDDLKKIFRNYNVSVEAVLGVFSAGKESRDVEGINNFVDMIKSSSDSFNARTEEISNDITSKITASASNFERNVSRAGIVVFALLLFCAVFVVSFFVYANRATSFIKKVGDAVKRMHGLNFNKSDVSDSIPFAHEEEFFELSDRVTNLATVISDNMKWMNERSTSMENDAERGKLVATYITSIMNSINIGIMVTDNLLRVSFVNSEFEKFWRVKRSRIVDVDVNDLPFMRLINGWKDTLERTLKDNGKTTTPSVLRTSRVLLSVMPMRSSDGREVIGTITVTHNRATAQSKKEYHGTLTKIQPE